MTILELCPTCKRSAAEINDRNLVCPCGRYRGPMLELFESSASFTQRVINTISELIEYKKMFAPVKWKNPYA